MPTARRDAGPWHRRKTEIYTEMVAAGELPRVPACAVSSRRPDAGWKLAVASTSAEPSVRAMLEQAAGQERAARFDVVLAGDVVARKKPAPDIYLWRSSGSACGRRDTRHRGLAERAARRAGGRAALRHDRQRLHRGRRQ